MMPLITAELSPKCSISFNPAMVQPLGVVTLSISSSGCLPDWSSRDAAPRAVWAAMISRKKEKAASVAYTCLTCGRCKEKCPMEIDVPEMCVELRKLIAEGGLLEDTSKNKEPDSSEKH